MCSGYGVILRNCYTNEGRRVAIDEKKAKHYLELAAMNGNVWQGIILVVLKVELIIII